MAFTPFAAVSTPINITDLTEKLLPVGADEIQISDSENGDSSKKVKFANFPVSGGTIAGTVQTFAGSLPTGYLDCDGSALDRIVYADLFAAIGIAFGEGDGATTFNVPDLRGRFIRGVDGGGGNDTDSATRTASGVNGNTGNNVGSLQTDDVKSHNHGILSATNTTFGGTPSFSYLTNGQSPIYRSSNVTGGNETRPKNIYMNYIIKY